MADKTLKVVILGVVDDVKKALSDVRGEADKTKGKLDSISSSMASVGKSMSLKVTAPIVAGMGLAVKAGAEEQQQMELLANTIRNNIPGASDAAIAGNEKWITSMQNATGVADGELRDAMQHLLISGMSIEEAQAALGTAMDISASKGKDLGSVTEAMAKANAGNIGALGRLGIATKDAAGNTLSFEQIMASAAATMGGAAAAGADTAAGRAEILKLKMGDLTEDIGMILIPVLDKLTGWLGKVVDWFSNLSPGAKQVAVTLAGIAAAVGPVLLVGSKVITMFSGVGKAFGILSKLLMANPWMLLIAATIALVTLIIANWDKIVAFVKKAWEWIKTNVGKVGEAISDAFRKAVDFVKNLFLNFTPLGLIIKNFDKIKALATEVKDWIVDKWDALIDFFKKIPSRISDAIGDVFRFLRDGFKRAVNWIIDKWNNFKIEIKLPAILGGATIRIDTPNIPRLHTGGIFHAPTPGGEGLAILKDWERVARAGQPAPVGGTGEMMLHITLLMPDGRVLLEEVRRANQMLLAG